MNIALFLDGTWQDHGDHTNIAQLWERVAPRDAAGAAQEVYYNAGVGTGGGTWDRLTGGAFGQGLDENITEAYRFIVERHRSDDDRIYLFGYSRGAFTARSSASSGFSTPSGASVSPEASGAGSPAGGTSSMTRR